MWTLVLDFVGGLLSSEGAGSLLGGLFGNSDDGSSKVGWYVAGALGVLLFFVLFVVALVGFGRRR